MSNIDSGIYSGTGTPNPNKVLNTGVYRSKTKRLKPEEDSYNNGAERTSNYDPLYTMSNVAFTGTDAVATIIIPKIGTNGGIISEGESIELGELQTISYSIHRENSPVRTIGHVSPRGFIKGGRTIAGSMIFTVFNEYAFYRIKQYKKMLARKNGFFAPLADMLPPFDLVLSFFNEYGQASKMKIFGVTIIDEGQTVSVDDLIIEQTYTYMARGIQPMVKMTAELPGKNKKDELLERDLKISRNIFGDEKIDRLALLYSGNVIDEIIKK